MKKPPLPSGGKADYPPSGRLSFYTLFRYLQAIGNEKKTILGHRIRPEVLYFNRSSSQRDRIPCRSRLAGYLL